MKKILVVLWHTRIKSYCGALADSYIAWAESSWAQVVKLDLITQKFNPNLILWENDKNIFDIAYLQQALKDCDHIVFVYPTRWYNMPAILKWFLDRVFLSWFAYKFVHWKLFPEKLLKWRTAHIITTTDGPWIYYKLFWNPWMDSLERTLNMCGISPIKTSSIYGVRKLTQSQKESKLKWINSLWKKLI